ncbi:MAG: Phenylalanine--tRNA ligase beta subunit [Firmicutes bacterium]|nr:Phenylalanine--tRNA ligase beta subunit [candidate division NPL-UPA2 bacterium]
MKVSLAWLKQFVDVEQPAAKLAEILTHAGIAVDAVSRVTLATAQAGQSVNDEVLELDLTPNRADCQSILGVAYEVAALTSKTVAEPVGVSVGKAQVSGPHLAVEIQAPSLCSGYLGLVLDVAVGESPLWLKNRLEGVGLRPVNNVVDITNFVMWELGQPLHAFDYDRIVGQRLIVRRSLPEESITLIDGTSPVMPEGTLVIADTTHALAIAGVMGGLDCEVSTATRRIVLESALFERASIRRTARALGLRTEASLRFDKGVDPSGISRALQRAAYVFQLLGVGQVLGECIGSEPLYCPCRPIQVRPERVNSLLGIDLAPSEMQAILLRLGMPTQVHGDVFLVSVPSRRGDVVQEIDLVEEIGRIHGFNNIPTDIMRGEVTQGRLTEDQRWLRSLRRTLLSLNVDEVVTLSFYDPENGTKFMLLEHHAFRRAVALANPLSRERSTLRPTLMPSMVEVLGYNQARQISGMSVFEIGTVYLPHAEKPLEQQNLCLGAYGVREGNWIEQSRPLDFFHVRGLVEKLLPDAEFVVGKESFLHPGRQAEIWQEGAKIGYVGEIHPLVGLKERAVVAEISVAGIPTSLGKPLYRGISASIAVERDIAFLVNESISAADILARIREAGGERITSATLFDVYVGTNTPLGMRSLAIRLELTAPGGASFTEAELSAILGKLRHVLEHAFGAVWRA